MIVAAAPAPPVPAPPGKPPLPILSSSSSLCRRSSSWWFSSGTSHGRDSATATTSSRATRRRWWSDPDGSQEDYASSSLEEEEYDYDYDYEDDAAFPGFGGAGELFDEPWFSKVFKMYGFLLPVMLVSMFAATGTKAFLMAMVFPLGQSAISFLLDAVWGRRKGDRDNRRRRPVQEEEEEDYYPEDANGFATGDRGNRYSGSSSYYEGRRGRRSYQSRASNDFVDAASTAVGADDNTKSSSSGDGWGGKTSSGGYGGWDEILDNDAAAAQEAKRSSSPFSAGNTDYGTKARPSATGEEDADYTAAGGGRRVEREVGAPPGRMRMRRQRMPRTMGLGSTRYKQAPLLMRLLVAVFPFMGSWFRL